MQFKNDMSLPRPIFPGDVYVVTRRCTRREFWLRPDQTTINAFLYCLFEASQRFGIVVLGWIAMSNHLHVIVYDPRGRLPDFACHFHQMLAKVLNVRWGRTENLWASEPASYTHLVEWADVFNMCVYALLNPVAAFQVEKACDWPGASSFMFLDGRTMKVKRPRFYFRSKGKMPAEVTVQLGQPPETMGAPPNWMDQLRVEVEHIEGRIREARLASGEHIAGRKAVLSASPSDRPETFEARRKIRPLVACQNVTRRIQVLAALKAFRTAYRRAWERLAAGARDVVFPPGTFALRRWCAAPASVEPVPLVPLPS